MNPREIGAAAALVSFGVKTAAIDWRGLGQALKQNVIGEPSRALNDLRAGKYFAPGSAWREVVWPSHPVFKGLAVALPALGVASALKVPAEQRGTSVGQTLGAIAGGTLTAPFGIAGSVAGSALGGALGRSLGGVFDAKPQRERPYHLDRSFVA